MTGAQSNAGVQGLLRLVETLQGDEAAGLGVVQRSRGQGAAEGPAHHALALLRLPGRIQRKRKGMSGGRIVGSPGHETTVGSHRFALATQGRIRRHM